MTLLWQWQNHNAPSYRTKCPGSGIGGVWILCNGINSWWWLYLITRKVAHVSGKSIDSTWARSCRNCRWWHLRNVKCFYDFLGYDSFHFSGLQTFYLKRVLLYVYYLVIAKIRIVNYHWWWHVIVGFNNIAIIEIGIFVV